VKGTSRHPALQNAKAAREAAESEERNRLLYVAMTRARDRLYVAGFETKSGRGQGCWYDLIEEALRDVCETKETEDGRTVLRYACPQSVPPEEPRNEATRLTSPEPLPDWAKRKAPREPATTFPLSPSRLAQLETDEIGDPLVTRTSAPSMVSPSPLALSSEYRFLRGTLTHALLEHLPSFPADRWADTARSFIALRGESLPENVRAGIVDEILSILRDSQFGSLFGPDSRAEVPVAADIPDPNGRRPSLRITGQIDRLVRLPGEVLLLDYKTNRPPPQEPEEVPKAYLLQLVAYRLVIDQVFPTLPVRAAILWTDGARLMPIPPNLLDSHEVLLWQHGSPQLDAL